MGVKSSGRSLALPRVSGRIHLSRPRRATRIYSSRMGARGGSERDRGVIEVAGVRRSYWLARAPRPPGQAPPPLLMALHGAGMDGRGMAWFTGLAGRGP